jgi:hypothetical protein
VSEAQGQLKEAERYVSECMEIFKKIGDKSMQKQASKYLDGIREKLSRT